MGKCFKNMNCDRTLVKRVFTFILALAMVIGNLIFVETPLVVHAEDGDVTIRLHYHREDGEYTGWDVWMWPDGGEGGAYPFEEVDGEQVATFVAAAGTTKVGFIVRTEDWTKDINEDQFIDISEMVDGSVDIYVESGVEGYTKEYGDDAVTGTKLKTAVYNGDGTITALFTADPDDAQFESIVVWGKAVRLPLQILQKVRRNLSIFLH